VSLKTRAAVLFVALCLFTVGMLILLTQDASSRPPVPPTLFKAVRAEWRTKAERIQAFDIAWCESRYSVRARNGQYLGLWQLGSWARARYGHGTTVRAQAHAAHALYHDYGWRQWQCR
jgi:hypothetical protein